MNVVHMVGSLEARYGGPSRSVRHLASATAALGHDVTVLTSAPAAQPDAVLGRLTIRTWRRAFPGALGRVPEMAAWLERAPCDVVHHHGLWLRALHYANRKAARGRLPLVISPRGMMSAWAWGQHRMRKALAARCVHPGALAAARGWHATSAEEAAEIRELGFAQPVCIAPNGIEPPDETEAATAGAHWRAQVPAAAGKSVALFYSRFHRKKRLLELIDLWRKTAPPDWLLLIVGIPEEFTVAQLREHARRTPGAAPIEIHEGAGQPPPYAVAALFLLPSQSENFGLVIAEAMARGVPVLVTDATPWTALNTDGLGWCVPWSEYPAALQAATAEEPAALRARGARAREWVLREFSWQRSARRLAAFYVSLREERK